MFCIAFTRKA